MTKDQSIVLSRLTPPLLLLEIIGIIDGFLSDRMHCVDLGVVKQFANLWFRTSGQPYRIPKEDVIKIDEAIKNFKVPTQVVRLSLSLLDHAFWKAKEWLNSLLHYSLVIYYWL